VPVEVDYGSEYRYRSPIVPQNTLAVVITQSARTADTLAALREAKHGGAAASAICNVVGSMATRETDGTIYTHAGPEIGVASTKAFTSQLVALYLLALRLGQAAARCRRGVEAAHRRAAAAAAAARADAEAGARVEEIAGAFTTGPTSCISAAASTTRSRSKAR
jgi:glucosamine--fructose-6-phosphate aminotransferase (isomerizing)